MNYTNEDKMEEMELEAKEDKICEHIYCTTCGQVKRIGMLVNVILVMSMLNLY